MHQVAKKEGLDHKDETDLTKNIKIVVPKAGNLTTEDEFLQPDPTTEDFQMYEYDDLKEPLIAALKINDLKKTSIIFVWLSEHPAEIDVAPIPVEDNTKAELPSANARQAQELKNMELRLRYRTNKMLEKGKLLLFLTILSLEWAKNV